MSLFTPSAFAMNPFLTFAADTVARTTVLLALVALAAFLRGAREMADRGGFTWMRDTVPTRELKAMFRP